jgi:hypothetical protein
MTRKVCEACGYRGEARAIVEQRVIPQDIAEEAGISDSGKVTLCNNCRNELYIWYSRKVSTMVYDPGTKRFRYRLPAEMAKEYEAAYRAFIEYKNRQRKRS